MSDEIKQKRDEDIQRKNYLQDQKLLKGEEKERKRNIVRIKNFHRLNSSPGTFNPYDAQRHQGFHHENFDWLPK